MGTDVHGKYYSNNAWHRGVERGEYEYADSEGYIAAFIYQNTQDRYVWGLMVDDSVPLDASNTGIEDRLRDAKAAALKALGL